MPSPFALQLVPRRRAIATVAAATAAFTLAACAPTETQQLDGTAGEVQDAVERFVSSAGRGDAGVICRDQFTEELREQFSAGGKPCEDAVRAAIDNADYTALTIESVKLPAGQDGDTATAITKTSVENRYRSITLQKVGEKWRIASFEASAKK